MASNRKPRRKILAVSSGGGHWVQLLRLRPAFEGDDVHYLTVNPSNRADVVPHPFFTVRHASRWNKFGLIVLAVQVLWVVMRVRPQVVVSTGAAPGYFALRVGKLLGARTIWLDSIANAEELSLSGRLAGKYADLWLTQWPHLAKTEGPKFAGTVL